MCFFTNPRFLIDFKRRKSVCSAAILIFIWSGQLHVYASTVTYCTTDDMYPSVNEDELKCVNCSKCPIGHEEVSPCTRTSDTQCRPCPEGTFNDGMHEFCRNCSRCEPGFYFIQKCNSTGDVTCDTCAEGMFTESYNNRVCRACKVCSINEVTVAKCTTRRNTQCGNCVRDHFRDDATFECVPCSHCYPNVSVIVRECQEKLGHSQQVCLPLGYVPRSAQGTMTTNTTLASTTPSSLDQSYIEIAILLAILTTAAIVTLSAGYICWKRSHSWVKFTSKSKRNNIKHRKTNKNQTPSCCIFCCAKDVLASIETPEEFLMKGGTINTQTSDLYCDAESGYLSVDKYTIRSMPSECMHSPYRKTSFGDSDWVSYKQSRMNEFQGNKGEILKQNISQIQDLVSITDSAVDIDDNISSIHCTRKCEESSCNAHANLPRLEYMGLPVNDDISKASAK